MAQTREETRRPYRLTERQLRHPAFKTALERLQALADDPESALASVQYHHRGGRRTRKEFFRSLSKLAPALLARLVLATGVIGHVDAHGRLCLHSQRTLALDAGISPSTLNRLLKRLEQAGYLVLRVSKVSSRLKGLLWKVRTKVCIKLTSLFFAELGMRRLWRKTQKWAAKKRRARIETSAQTEAAAAIKAQTKAQEGRAGWERMVAKIRDEERAERERKATQACVEAISANPRVSYEDLKALRDRIRASDTA